MAVGTIVKVELLRARRKNFEEMALFEVLADKDSEVAELLKELKELQG